jgi:hypothetical protein
LQARQLKRRGRRRPCRSEHRAATGLTSPARPRATGVGQRQPHARPRPCAPRGQSRSSGTARGASDRRDHRVAIAVASSRPGRETNAIVRRGAPSALRESTVAAACHVMGAEQDSRHVRSSASSAGQGTLLDHASMCSPSFGVSDVNEGPVPGAVDALCEACHRRHPRQRLRLNALRSRIGCAGLGSWRRPLAGGLAGRHGRATNTSSLTRCGTS